MTGRHANKVVASVAEALAPLRDGMTILVGGFGLSGNAEALIRGVIERGVRDLTVVSNNCGNLGKGLALWLKAGIVRKVVCSYIGNNDDLHTRRASGEIEVEINPQGTLAERMRAAGAGIVGKVICSYIGNNDDLHTRMASGEIEVEINPQGTLAERMRAAGAGIPAFYTPTGVGTVVEQGKETKEFDGRRYVLERALPGDVALVRAHTADRFGNLRFWRTARNFNPVMATAAKLTLVECDHLAEIGALDPDDVHLSGIHVHRIVHVPEHENAFEYRNVRKRP